MVMVVPLHGKKAAGRVALVDDEDFEMVSQYRWHVVETVRPGGRVNGPYTHAQPHRNAPAFYMHNLITGWRCVDHKDHDGLNNQRYNLREADARKNAANQRPRSDGFRSQYKGVGRRVRNGQLRRWYATIELKHLGYFSDEELAARAYDAAALEAWGEFAYLNFPSEE